MVDQLKLMIWILFALGCLWFIQSFLGGGAIKIVTTLVAEFKSLRKSFSERGAMNMAGGLVLLVVVASVLIFDNLGKLAKVGATPSADDGTAKIVLFFGSLFFIAGYFLICVRFTGGTNGDGSPD